MADQIPNPPSRPGPSAENGANRLRGNGNHINVGRRNASAKAHRRIRVPNAVVWPSTARPPHRPPRS